MKQVCPLYRVQFNAVEQYTYDRQTDRQTEVNLPVFVLSAYRYNRGSSCPFQPDG